MNCFVVLRLLMGLLPFSNPSTLGATHKSIFSRKTSNCRLGGGCVSDVTFFKQLYFINFSKVLTVESGMFDKALNGLTFFIKAKWNELASIN